MTIIHFKNQSIEDLSEIIDGVLYKEQWKPIEGFEKYYHISNFGRVKSFHNYDPIILSQQVNKRGYSLIGLYKKNVFKLAKVHRLVGIAFIDNPNNFSEINHLGEKTDNRFTKIEWCDRQQNIDHAIKTGLTRQKGEDSANSILTNIQALEIFNSNLSTKELAAFYKTSTTTIVQVKNGTTYSSITGKKHFILKKRLDPDKVLSIFNAKGIYPEISARFHVSYMVVLNIKNGKVFSKITGKKYKNTTSLSNEKILNIFHSKESIRKTAKEFKISQQTVIKIRKKEWHYKITKDLI